MITFTPDVNLGNLVTGAIVAGLGYGVRRLYKLVDDAIARHDQALADVCDHAEVINLHTSILVDAGMAKGRPIPLVEERRRRPRVYAPHGEGEPYV